MGIDSKKAIKFWRGFLVFALIFAWLFSGWPKVWQNPPFPPEVLTTKAASPEPFAYTGGSQDFNPANGIYAVDVECWGGGGGGGSINNNGGGGGGGGAYAKSTGVAVTPGTGYAVDVGAGGSSEVNGADSTFGVTTVVADGGGAAANNNNGTGGTLAASTYNDAASHAGGNGGDGNTTGDVGAGGGGAGGPDGIGNTADNASNNVSTAGGDANSSVGTGTGGAANDGAAGSPGNNDLTKGGGGGGGSEAAQVGGAGGVPGGGGGGGSDNALGGTGGHGRCIISYTDTWAPSVTQATLDNTWTFDTAPNNNTDGQISMAATAGYDYSTISYSFTYTACASNQGANGTDSGWQAGASYSDIGLDPNKCYGYTVQTKDSLEQTGTASVASETYSSANVPGQPTLNGATATSLILTNDENSNPAASPITLFAVQVVTGDAGWITNWVNGSGEPVAGEVWLRDDQLDGLVIGGGGTPLTAGTTYGVQVKAQNENGDPTDLSLEGQGATSAAVFSVTIDPENFSYGTMNDNTASSTLTLWSEAGIIATNGDAIADFYIYGANTTNWTLDAATSTPDYYTHKFCNETDNNCLASGPYGASFIALTTSPQLLKGSVGIGETVAFQLSMHTPNPSSVYTTQSAIVTVQASAP